MPDTTPEPVPLPGHDRLNGWKEIAAFLGKGVRTAQRWERHYGLPVHRLGHEGGEIVFAFRSEIDRWSRARDGPGGDAADALDDETAAPAGAPRTRWRWPAVAALVIAAAAGGWLVAHAPFVTGPGQPASWAVEGDTLSVFDDRGALLWSHRFEALLSKATYLLPPTPPARRVSIQDLDGDGTPEVLFGVVPTNQHSERGQGLVCFNADGTVRFAVEPTDRVRFGTTTYSGPWLFYQFFMTRAPGGAMTVWAVFVHGLEFPTKLVELDAHGAVKSTYWSDGYVELVSPTRWQHRDVVLVGATNNETRGGSLAIFDGDHVHGSAPSEKPGYRCASCGPGWPDVFLVFPRRDVAREAGGQAAVSHAWVDANGRVHVDSTEFAVSLPSRPNADVWYWFSPDLVPERAEVTSELLHTHLLMEEAGLLHHPFGIQDEQDFFPVLRWNGKGYDALPRAPVTR